MILAEKDTNFLFSVQLHNGKTDKFIKLELFETITNTVIGTYSLNHISSGMYVKNDVPSNVNGVFLAKYTVYNDSLLTQKDKRYSIELEYIRVESIIETLTSTIDFGDGSTV